MVESGIPQSNALAEAGLDSLAELMSRDPEGYSSQDKGRIIEALRAMRAKWEAAEAQAPKGKSRAKASPETQSSISSETAKDLGL